MLRFPLPTHFREKQSALEVTDVQSTEAYLFIYSNAEFDFVSAMINILFYFF